MSQVNTDHQMNYEFEKRSSAFTLSDMEVFLFPELMMALVLGNILSPRIWLWREDPWFQDLDKMNWNRRLQRLKQYIMDHYSFNLDLETWGLTSKEKELKRFQSFVDPEFFARSNALFGYEGDKYYFDLDIRRHFGLDQYTSNIIPYWKTETVEAMDAFRLKPGYSHGAGECVSLAALYAAALFVVLKIPLTDIFLMATPLHSQNYIMQEDGVITNNRRLVTKTMWFNGTELTEKARRALEHERVTIVSHLSGMIHIDYPQATINQENYQQFKTHLSRYLSAPLSFELLINFLRVHSKYQRFFQFEYNVEGHKYYIKAERLFAYEHGSQYRIGDQSRKKMLAEIDDEEFDLQPHRARTVLNLLEAQLQGQSLECDGQQLRDRLKQFLPEDPIIDSMLTQLCEYLHVEPLMPDDRLKQFKQEPAINLSPEMSRSQIMDTLTGMRSNHPTVDLAFYAHRQLDHRGWPAFIRACLERNPVSITFFQAMADHEVMATLQQWQARSIYDEQGLATPDEVVNFMSGDGLEKALTLSAVLKQRYLGQSMKLISSGEQVKLLAPNQTYEFTSQKGYQVELDL